MTHFLRSEKKPEGHKLEDLLTLLRADIVHRCEGIAADTRPKALHGMANKAALDSTRVLDRAFGLSQALHGSPARIGKAYTA